MAELNQLESIQAVESQLEQMSRLREETLARGDLEAMKQRVEVRKDAYYVVRNYWITISLGLFSNCLRPR